MLQMPRKGRNSRETLQALPRAWCFKKTGKYQYSNSRRHTKRRSHQAYWHGRSFIGRRGRRLICENKCYSTSGFSPGRFRLGYGSLRAALKNDFRGRRCYRNFGRETLGAYSGAFKSGRYFTLTGQGRAEGKGRERKSFNTSPPEAPQKTFARSQKTSFGFGERRVIINICNQFYLCLKIRS